MEIKKHNKFIYRYFRASFTIAPAKPAYYRALRVIFIIGIPFLFGIHFDLLKEVSLLVLAAVNVTIIDMGGLTYRKLSRTLLFVTLLNATGAAIAMLAGANVIWAVLVTAIWLASVAMLGLLGRAGVMAALGSSVIFVIMIAMPGDITAAISTFIILLIGGLWAMLFALVAWPINPYGPIRKAVARCFIENSNFLRNIAPHCNNDITDKLPSDEQIISDVIHRRFRKSMDEAHNMLINERKGRMGNSNVEDALISLLHSVAKDYRTIVTIMIWFKNEGKDIHVSNTNSLSDFFIALANIQDEIANLIMHPDKNIINLKQSIVDLQEEYLLGNNKIIVGQSKEIQNILEQALERSGLEVVTAQQQHPSYKENKNRDFQKSLITDKKISFIKLVRSNLTFESSGFRHAIRIGLTAAIAELIAYLFHLPHGYWLPLTVVIIMSPDFGGSFLVRSLQRGVGTILGGLFAGFLLLYIHDEMVIFALLLVFTFFAISLITINYALFVFFLTPVIVTMLSLSGSGGLDIPLDRVLDTIIGIGLSLIAGAVLFPVWERNVYSIKFSEMLDVVNKYINTIISASKGDKVSTSVFSHLNREIELSAEIANSSFQQALNQPGFNTKIIPYLISFLNLSNRLISGIITIKDYLEIRKSQNINLDIFLLVGYKMAELINVMSKTIQSQNPNEIIFDDKVIKLLHDMEKLVKEIEGIYIEFANKPSSEINVFTIEIKHLLEVVQNMVTEVNSITSINMGLSAEDDYLVA